MAKRRSKSRGEQGHDRRKSGPTPSRKGQAQRGQKVQRADPGLAARAIADALIDISGRRPEAQRSAHPGELSITIATSPREGLSLAVEHRLVRAALLYADHVTLISPSAFLLNAAEAIRDASDAEVIELAQRAGPYIAGYDTRAGKIPAALLANLLGGTPPHIRQELRQVVDTMTDIPERWALEQARVAGLLTVESLARRAEDEAHLADIREHLVEHTWSDGVGLDGAAEILVSRLMGLLTTSRSLPLLDDGMGEFARTGIAEGLFVPASSAGKRTAQAGSATGFLERLPTFPAASLDEVIDIRAELQGPLLKFRAEVVKLALAMQHQALQPDFAAEIDAHWHATVAPALQEIKERTHQNTYLRRLRNEVVDPDRLVEGATGLAGGGVLGVMMGSTSATAFATAAASMGLGAVLKARKTQLEADSEARGSGFWFLHEVDQRLS